MKGNTDKCHLIVSTDEPKEIRVGEYLLKNSTCEKWFGIKIDNKLILMSEVYVRRQIIN